MNRRQDRAWTAPRRRSPSPGTERRRPGCQTTCPARRAAHRHRGLDEEREPQERAGRDERHRIHGQASQSERGRRLRGGVSGHACSLFFLLDVLLARPDRWPGREIPGTRRAAGAAATSAPVQPGRQSQRTAGFRESPGLRPDFRRRWAGELGVTRQTFLSAVRQVTDINV